MGAGYKKIESAEDSTKKRNNAKGDEDRKIETAEVDAGRKAGEKVNPEKQYAEKKVNRVSQELMANAMNDIVQGGQGFEETLKKWRKAKRHNDDRNTRQGLHSDLVEWKREWKQCWKTHKKEFTLSPDYGVIKLRYDMAKRNLKGALNRVNTRKGERNHLQKEAKKKPPRTMTQAWVRVKQTRREPAENPQKRAKPTSTI